MEDTDIRNQLLSELIDKMHSRLADKAYPDEKPPVDAKAEEKPEVKEEPKSEEAEGEISDEEISELMKSAE